MASSPDVGDLIIAALAAAGQPADNLVISAATPLSDGGLELNSLGLVRALVALEEVLDTELDDAALMTADFRTVGDVTAAITHFLRPACA